MTKKTDEKVVSVTPPEKPEKIENVSKESGKVIFKTKDYSKFKLLEGNRIVDESRVTKLIGSIKLVGYITNPIIINEKHEVIDGQTRLEALKRLKLPVEYVVVRGIGIAECVAMNLHQKNWGALDFIRSYAKQGKEDYIKLLKSIETLSKFSNFPIRAIAYASQKCGSLVHSYSQNITSGRFEFQKDVDDVIADLECAYKFLLLCRERGRPFEIISAIVFIKRKLGSGISDFYDKVRKNTHKLRNFYGATDTLAAFSEIYNIKLGELRKRYFDIEYKREFAEKSDGTKLA